MSVYGPDHHFQEQWLGVGDVTSFFCILRSVSVNQSGGFSVEIGVLYLSHVMLVQAELIVCSTKADTFFGRRSASLIKDFWTLCIY